MHESFIMWASLSMMGASSLPPSLTLSLTLIHSFFFAPTFSPPSSLHTSRRPFQFSSYFFAFLCFHLIYFCNCFCKENSPTVIRTVSSTWQLRGRLSSRFVRLIFTAPLLVKLLRRLMCSWKGRLRWEKKEKPDLDQSCDPDKFCPAWPFFLFGV